MVASSHVKHVIRSSPACRMRWSCTAAYAVRPQIGPNIRGRVGDPFSLVGGMWKSFHGLRPCAPGWWRLHCVPAPLQPQGRLRRRLRRWPAATLDLGASTREEQALTGRPGACPGMAQAPPPRGKEPAGARGSAVVQLRPWQRARGSARRHRGSIVGGRRDISPDRPPGPSSEGFTSTDRCLLKGGRRPSAEPTRRRSALEQVASRAQAESQGRAFPSCSRGPAIRRSDAGFGRFSALLKWARDRPETVQARPLVLQCPMPCQHAVSWLKGMISAHSPTPPLYDISYPLRVHEMS